MTPPDAAGRHRAYAAQLAELIAGTTDWSAPSPVGGWTARDVVDHLTTWFPAFVHSGSPYGWTQRHSASGSPADAWTEQTLAVQLILDDPAQAQSSFSHPHLPPCTLEDAVDRFYTADVFMHAWDLARATGQELELDPDYATQLLEGMRPMEAVLRDSGQYGPAHPVADDAAPVEKLMAFVGRDPDWRA